FAAKAIHLPSGDHTGSVSVSPLVRRRGLRPSVGKSHSSVLPSFFSMSYEVTAAHAVRPSGEIVGVPMRLIAHRSSTLSGCRFRGMDAGCPYGRGLSGPRAKARIVPG